MGKTKFLKESKDTVSRQKLDYWVKQKPFLEGLTEENLDLQHTKFKKKTMFAKQENFPPNKEKRTTQYSEGVMPENLFQQIGFEIK